MVGAHVSDGTGGPLPALGPTPSGERERERDGGTVEEADGGAPEASRFPRGGQGGVQAVLGGGCQEQSK